LFKAYANDSILTVTKVSKKANTNVGIKLELVIVVLLLFLLAAFFMLGYVIANQSNDKDISPSTASNMSHSKFDVPAGQPQPQITNLTASKDPKMGWNIKIETKDFEFTPQNANQKHQPGQGHAHLYVDGIKITRVYSNYYYLSGFNDGIHELTITLNTNDHKDYYVNGQQISKTVKIVGDHGHSPDTPTDHGH
jgi:hypothetical protein